MCSLFGRQILFSVVMQITLETVHMCMMPIYDPLSVPCLCIHHVYTLGPGYIKLAYIEFSYT